MILLKVNTRVEREKGDRAFWGQQARLEWHQPWRCAEGGVSTEFITSFFVKPATALSPHSYVLTICNFPSRINYLELFNVPDYSDKKKVIFKNSFQRLSYKTVETDQ